MKEVKLKVNTKLIIGYEYFNGEKEIVRINESDLIVNNFLRILACFPLLRLDNDSSQSFSLTKDDGSTYTISSQSVFGTYVIAVGQGTTSPSPSDYKLESEIARSDVLNPIEISIDDTNRIVEATIYQTISGTSGVSISEAGLFSRYSNNYFLLCRDTFNAVTIPSDAYASVTYKITFQL